MQNIYGKVFFYNFIFISFFGWNSIFRFSYGFHTHLHNRYECNVYLLFGFQFLHLLLCLIIHGISSKHFRQSNKSNAFKKAKRSDNILEERRRREREKKTFAQLTIKWITNRPQWIKTRASKWVKERKSSRSSRTKELR